MFKLYLHLLSPIREESNVITTKSEKDPPRWTLVLLHDQNTNHCDNFCIPKEDMLNKAVKKEKKASAWNAKLGSRPTALLKLSILFCIRASWESALGRQYEKWALKWKVKLDREVSDRKVHACWCLCILKIGHVGRNSPSFRKTPSRPWRKHIGNECGLVG